MSSPAPVFLSFLLLAGAAHAESVKTSAESGRASSSASDRVVRVERPLLGSTALALVAPPEGRSDAEISAAVDAALAELELLAGLVDSARPDSDVSRVNAGAGAAPVVVAPEVFEMLLEGQRLAALSKGAFDPTTAAVAELWNFPQGGSAQPAAGTPPAEAALKERLGLVSHKDLTLDEAARSAKLARAGQRIGLRALAKGYALDRAAASLVSAGLNNFVLAAGGDIVVRGKRGDRAWMVGVQDPRGAEHFAALQGLDGAFMTTGDYERFFFAGDERLHDVLDPRSGTPAADVRSVTVIAANAMTAEALSSAVFVLGPKHGLRLVNRLKNVEAIMVTSKNSVLLSKGLKRKVRWRPPTDAR